MAFKDSWKKKRRQGWIKERRDHYIFCEGLCTEPNYFGSLIGNFKHLTIYGIGYKRGKYNIYLIYLHKCQQFM